MHYWRFLFTLCLTLAMFWEVLFSVRQVVLSAEGADLHGQFLAWYEFGFGELRKGNLPLWNPHLFSGLPFLAGFKSALFYPPNLIFLVLPGTLAANALIALDVFLAGLFFFLDFFLRRLGLLVLSGSRAVRESECASD
jgi:hypothetical protein